MSGLSSSAIAASAIAAIAVRERTRANWVLMPRDSKAPFRRGERSSNHRWAERPAFCKNRSQLHSNRAPPNPYDISAFSRKTCKVQQQRFTETMPARLGLDEQIFKIQRGLPDERRECGEEQRESF